MLTDDEVRELADLGRRIEEHYGSAQDTEWAFDADGKVVDAPVAAGDRRPAARPARRRPHDGEVLVARPRRRAGRGSGRSASSATSPTRTSSATTRFSSPT